MCVGRSDLQRTAFGTGSNLTALKVSGMVYTARACVRACVCVCV